MNRTATATAVVLVALLAAGCSGGGDDGKASPASTAGSSTQSGGKLSAEWGPKLSAAADGDKAVCNAVGSQDCADHLTDIASVVTDLETAVDEAGGKTAYPQTVQELDKVNKAVDAYTEHECLRDENAGIEGSPCPDDAQTILSGGETLPLALKADEGA